VPVGEKFRAKPAFSVISSDVTVSWSVLFCTFLFSFFVLMSLVADYGSSEDDSVEEGDENAGSTIR